jgi:hypothetical protein
LPLEPQPATTATTIAGARREPRSRHERRNVRTREPYRKTLPRPSRTHGSRPVTKGRASGRASADPSGQTPLSRQTSWLLFTEQL